MFLNNYLIKSIFVGLIARKNAGLVRQPTGLSNKSINSGGAMTIFDMLEQSGVLTLLGMGVVFGFLITMVIVVSVAGKIIGKVVKDEGDNTAAPQKPGNGAVQAAISAAVNEYRKNN